MHGSGPEASGHRELLTFIDRQALRISIMARLTVSPQVAWSIVENHHEECFSRHNKRAHACRPQLSFIARSDRTIEREPHDSELGSEG